jgi:hypothetical protein
MKYAVTIFDNIRNVTNPIEKDLREVLMAIRDGAYKEQVEAIRNCKEDHKIPSLKQNLPCVLYAGLFNKGIEKINERGEKTISFRDDKSLTLHSGFVPIDMDGISDIEAKKEELKKNPYIFALWTSASGKGIHGIIKIGDTNKHAEHYKAILDMIQGLDPTARNPSRVLFMSYDPNIYINSSASIFYNILKEEETAPANIKFGDGYTDYKKIDVASRMIRLAPDGEKHHILLKAAHLMGGYVATKHIEYNIAKGILEHEISKKDVDNMELAKKTIEDGLRHGMTMPISELETSFREATREIGVMEEDLSFLASNTRDDDFIYKFRAGLIPMGLPFGYTELDEHLRLKEGEFYASLAHSHIGKTTVNLWLIFLSAIHYDWNWMMYMGENQSASIKMKLMEFFIGKKIIQMNDHEHNVALKFVDEHFFILSTDNMYTYGEILEHAKVLMQYKSLKGVFIDPYNSLKMELTAAKNKYIYDYEAYSEMLNFTKKYNTTIFLSVHTTTASQRERDSEGNQKMPHAADTEGGAALYNRVDYFITLHRKIKSQDEWMYTQVSIDKVRNGETGGKPTRTGNPVMIKMNRGLEFTDINGALPFDREKLLIKYKCRF